MNEKEKGLLSAFIQEPTLFEKVTINTKLLNGQCLKIFKEIRRQFKESQNFKLEIAADKLNMKITDLTFPGFYRLDVKGIESIIREIEREGLNKKLLTLTNKEASTFDKTGIVDGESMTNIRQLFSRIDSLNTSGQQFTTYDNIELKEVHWLWPGFIPLGMITLVAGHPGVGKSFFTTWLAAKLSKGGTLPGPEPKTQIEPCKTIIISADDDPEQLIKARLIGNAAVEEKILNLDNPINFSLDNISELDRQLEKDKDIRVTMLDHLNAFLGDTDYFRDPDVIQKLLPLKEMAEARKVSIVAVVHFNKREDSDLITRIGGSMAFAKIPRSIIGISYDNRDTGEDNQDTRLLSSMKLNIARKPKTLAFKINDNLRIDFDDKPIDMDAETIFSRESRERKQQHRASESWLLSYLEQNIECTGKEAIKAAEEDGIPERTLYRAKKKLDAQRLTESLETGFGKDKRSYWRLIPKDSGAEKQ